MFLLKKNGEAKIENGNKWLQEKISVVRIEEGIQLDDNDCKDLEDKTDRLLNNFDVGTFLPKGGFNTKR